jgi:caffeoyl-CoA O-methyltransferase
MARAGCFRVAVVAVIAAAIIAAAAQAIPSWMAVAAAQEAASPPSSEIAAGTARLLAQIKAADSDLLAVSEEDGRFLRVMVTASGATRALEIGGANGYSAIWIGLGLRQTGGHLTTIEYDPARARIAAANIAAAGLSETVTVVAGDAFREIPRLTGDFDFVFLDAWKRDYKRFFETMLPRLRRRGLFLAHNVVNKRGEMPDFLDAIQHNASVMSSIVAPSGEGMSISVKLR